jgi:hypothetical protein
MDEAEVVDETREVESEVESVKEIPINKET